MEQLIHSAPRLSEEEYLRLEEAAKARHEFRDGQVVDMAGGTIAHIEIGSNLIRELGVRLKGRPCKTLGSDLKVRIGRSGNYFYPDVTVVCGAVEFFPPDRKTAITNPRLIVEVTSPSTEADDRGKTFTDYRSLDSLQEYLLVSQERMEVETFYRQQDGIWAIGPRFTGAEQSVRLSCLQIEIPITEIYAGVEFVPPTPRTAPVE
jgi:Uma2 family endonuclease